MSGEALGRPAPGPVVPGDQDVPDGAISRANKSSAWRLLWLAVMRTITSRDADVRACSPYKVSAPNKSMWLDVKSDKPACANKMRQRCNTASPVRCALAAASMPMMTMLPVHR